MKTQAPLAVGFVLTALLIGPAAFAQNETADLNRVEVHGQQRPADTPRFDVHESCANIDVALQRPLDMAAFRQGQTGTVRVEFKVVDGRTSEVKSLGGPQVYHDDIHRAMRHVSCSGSSAAAEQRYAMLIDFVAPDDESLASTGTRVALRELKTVIRQ